MTASLRQTVGDVDRLDAKARPRLANFGQVMRPSRGYSLT